MPDYEIILWDMKRFDITTNAFVNEACEKKKWAFAADYIRLYALYTEGGIYLDSDVLVKKSFDEFLDNGFFTSVEWLDYVIEKQKTLSLIHPDGTSKIPHTKKPGIGLQAAIMGGVSGHPFLRDCLEWYHNRHFVQENGKLSPVFIAPDVFAMVAEAFGLKYSDRLQRLEENMLVLPSKYFAGNLQLCTGFEYAVHCCAGSWLEKPTRLYKAYCAIRRKIVRNVFLRALFGKSQLEG